MVELTAPHSTHKLHLLSTQEPSPTTGCGSEQTRYPLTVSEPLQYLALYPRDPLILNCRGRASWLGVYTPLGLKDRE